MRPTALLKLALAGACASVGAFAQASFQLQNLWPPLGLDAPVYDWTGGRLTGSQWRAELYGGETADSLTPTVGWTIRTRDFATFVWPGYFWLSGAERVALEAPPEGWAWLQVKVWDVQLGAPYEEASAHGLGGYGESALFYAKGGGPSVNPPSPPSPLIGLQSFSVLQEVPEPPAWLLFVSGIGVFFWGVRRNKVRVAEQE